MLEGLNAKAGKYAVFGVHDYYNKTSKEFIKNMVKRKKGIPASKMMFPGL